MTAERKYIDTTLSDGEEIRTRYPENLPIIEEIKEKNPDAWVKTRKYILCTGIIPDWLLAALRASPKTFHRWVVSVDGEEHLVCAKTKEQAINCVRFRLYGITPMEKCPPMDAKRDDDGNIKRSPNALSREDMLNRLRKINM